MKKTDDIAFDLTYIIYDYAYIEIDYDRDPEIKNPYEVAEKIVAYLKANNLLVNESKENDIEDSRST